MCKYLIVTGGIVSGSGKGVSCASIALLMRMKGHSVQYVKFDPYLNVNAGILAPREHGECFLCDDGTETDLDLGHVERLANITTSKNNICTSGTLYKELIEEQEKGSYLGETVQIIPHITDKIISRLEELGKDVDLVVAEIGGTVGDIESSAFYEAIRQFKQRHYDDVLIAMVAPILWVPTIKEFKTKPLQNAVRELQRNGLNADILLCRVDRPVPEQILDKVSSVTNVPRTCVFDAPDVSSIYEVPICFYDRHVDDLITDKFHLKRNGCRIHKYRDLVEKYTNNKDISELNIAVFGKYDNCDEAYISLKEALQHAGIANNFKVNIKWVNAEELEGKKDVSEYFKDIHGIIVPGGFDSRGVEGKIKAIKYVRENKIPFLGICLGLQCAVIEFARNVCGIKNANSMEFDKECKNPVVHFIAGQENIETKSGTMRLGAYDCKLKKDSLAISLYGQKIISERHRHRLEVNDKYVEDYEKKGFVVSGRNPETNLIEIMELTDHPYFIGSQAHPEFKSRLIKPAALFDGLVKACIERK